MAPIALLIFAAVYLIIILGEHSPRHLDRPAAALIGAVLMVITGVLTRAQALASIDFATLALLFGMMIIVHYATASGLLEALANKLMHYGRTPSQLLWAVCFTAGVLSALFVNDTICLLMTPLLLVVARRASLPAVPFLLCLATSSNVGSAMTITGNPQNMLIGQSSHWSWAGFALRMVPIGIICLLVNGLIVRTVYAKQLRTPAGVLQSDVVEPTIPFNKKLAVKTIIITVCLLVGFLAGAPMDMVALTSGTVLLVWANRPPEETFANIDWSLLLFFAGLFVVVRGVTVTQTALMNQLVPQITQHTGTLSGLSAFAGATVIGSNIFGNVPLVMLVRTWMVSAPNAQLLWLILAMASTFAGNLTLVGSVANLIVANGAKNECPLGFWEFLKAGVPSTVVTVIIGVCCLYLYKVFGWS
ncbi:MAG TPA: anion transporter [Candidatus Obscuribacterales bacterium]